ncbi:MAG TPA: hypothetical protein VK142_06030, partial [Bacillota bacterium]|nr:hypothetical protein [Bacillota bacterium]
KELAISLNTTSTKINDKVLGMIRKTDVSYKGFPYKKTFSRSYILDVRLNIQTWMHTKEKRFLFCQNQFLSQSNLQ